MAEVMRTKMKARIKYVCEEALRRVTPNEVERQKTLEFSKRLVETLKCELLRIGLDSDVQIEGSIAKDTWLAGEKDIDIFVLLPLDCGRDAFLRVLEAAKRVAGENCLEAYAEHPYLEAYIDGFTVNFVPCFKVKDASEAKSSVDRTPFHTLYVKSKISEKVRDEIRLLKAFMHGIGVYGAEIKVGGFSGYLCELLTLYYGSFEKVLEAASRWRRGEVIDIEGHYGNPEEAERIFRNEPLIVIDPVDKGRNVASAVRVDRLSEFIIASRIFLKNPDIKFFYPEVAETYSVDELLRAMNSRGSAFIFVKTGPIRAVPDILWGQLFRSQKALIKLLNQFDFEVTRSEVWSDERSVNIFLLELSSRFLPSAKKHIGPPVEKVEDCERFLEKHLCSNLVLSGPRIEGDRLVVERSRRYTDAVELLRENLKDGGRKLGVASLVSKAFIDSLEILVNEEVVNLYSLNHEFAFFLTRYLKGRPHWLF
ncbi:CCA tRNA nucleotidyltransferase [Candidatus Bathyarchaeota archaeon]|nr:CCA tRNA nucleotidyltransferase [Candidatus Bathyarchaeota archaeon]